jgi:hypothetical protein
MAIVADAPPVLNLSRRTCRGARHLRSLAAAKSSPRAEPPPAPAAQAPDGRGGDLTLDQVLPLICMNNLVTALWQRFILTWLTMIHRMVTTRRIPRDLTNVIQLTQMMLRRLRKV